MESDTRRRRLNKVNLKKDKDEDELEESGS